MDHRHPNFLSEQLSSPFDLQNVGDQELSASERTLFDLFDKARFDFFEKAQDNLSSVSNGSRISGDIARGIARQFPSNGSSEEHESYLWSLWELVILIAGEIPYNHIWQEILSGTCEHLATIDKGTITIWGVSDQFTLA